MYFVWFSSTFLRLFEFLQIKERGPNFWGQPILQKVWIIWSLLLYFNLKVFVDPNSLSFIRSQCILHDWGVLFSESWNFCKLKTVDLVSGGKQFLQKVWIISSLLLYLNFKSFLDPKWLPCIRFLCILHDSGELFSESWSF